MVAKYFSLALFPYMIFSLPDEEHIFGSALCYKPSLWDLKNDKISFYNLGYSFTSDITLSKDNQSLLSLTLPTNLLDDDEEEEEQDDGMEPAVSPIILWDAQNQKLLQEYWHPHANKGKRVKKYSDAEKLYPSHVIFNEDETRVIGGFSDGSLVIFEKGTARPIKIIKAGEKYITQLFLELFSY